MQLTYFKPMFNFPTSHPLTKKYQKFKGFFIVTGGIRGIEMEHWFEVSYIRGNG